MKKYPILHLFFTALLGWISLLPVQAQFDAGAVGLTEAKLVDRAWHLSSKEDNNYLLKVSGGVVLANDNNINAASTFVIDDGPEDNKWWTSDVRWFFIKSQSTGQYLTVQGNVAGVAVTLTPLIDGEGAAIYSQQFRLIATAQPGWYKIRSRMSQGSDPDLVLELNGSGQLIVDKPKLDPSSEQKFAFNLAMPATTLRYAVISNASRHFFSDNGILIEGTPAVHIRNSNQSVVWQFLSAGSGYYRIYNTLTKLYLALPPEGGNELIMTASTGTDTQWKLIRNDDTFFIASRIDESRIINMNNHPDSGNPLYCTIGAVSGREWILTTLPDEPIPTIGNFDRIADGDLPVTCPPFYGPNFKRGLIERVGLNASLNTMDDYFAFIREAIAAEVGADKVDEMLIRFDLNNPGHRVDLALMVRKYITDVLPLTPRNNWSSAAQAAIAELESKIQVVRLDYAIRLNNAWNDFSEDFGNQSLSFSDLIDNIDASGFVWPNIYTTTSNQSALLVQYTVAANTFGERNAAIVGGTFIGAFVSLAIPDLAITSAIFSALPASAPAGAYPVLAGAGPVVTVAVIAAATIAVKAIEVSELNAFIAELNSQIAAANAPVFIDAIQTSPNLVDRVRLLADLDYLLGAPMPNGFQFNTDDNIYQPTFTLDCNSNITLSLDENGTATLTPQMCGTVWQYCGTQILYALTKSQFDCDDIGVNEGIIFIVRNKASESALDFYIQKCTLTVNVVDEILPSITCPGTQTRVLDANCATTILNYASLASNVGDNCGVAGVTQSPAPGTIVDDAGNMSVTLTATDENSKSSSCTFTVTKVDNTSPTALCFNQTVTFNGEEQVELTANDLADAHDNCGVASMALTPAVITCGQVGQTVPVTVTVTDINNNVSICTSQITVTGLPCGWSKNPDGVGCANGSEIAYDPATGVWTATSTNCYYAGAYTADGMAFGQHSLCGDGSITAQVTGISGALGWAGLVMRENNTPGAKKAQLMTNLSTMNRREFRTTTGGQAMPQQFSSQNRYWLRIVRTGNQFSTFVSPNGQTWYLSSAQNIPMEACIQVGLATTNYTANSTVTATFANVTSTGGSNNLIAAPDLPTQATPKPIDFMVFPNPTSGETYLDLPACLGRQVNIQLYSPQGQLLQTAAYSEAPSEIKLDLSAYQSGMYFVGIKGEGIQEVCKRVVLKK